MRYNSRRGINQIIPLGNICTRQSNRESVVNHHSVIQPSVNINIDLSNIIKESIDISNKVEPTKVEKPISKIETVILIDPIYIF